jgi:intracellular multiplication protein IcmO
VAGVRTGTLKAKYEYRHEAILRDSRPFRVKMQEGLQQPWIAGSVFICGIACIYSNYPYLFLSSDLIFFFMALYFWWLRKCDIVLPFRLPKSADRVDARYLRPDGSAGHSDGILYLGNDLATGEEIWFTNGDARTHVLYLGTTGSGKTFGLKSFSCNALTWSSGYIYIDGKADTDLWSTLCAMARRFGRDDDMLIMNYMTGGTGARVPSNTLNPFSSGSASYLTNMLVSLMPDAGGDNAMWKERAISLVMAIMPCLVWKRDNQNIPLSIGMVRTYLTFKATVKLSRDAAVPQHIRAGLIAYLNELPGYVNDVFDDEGNEKPMPPDAGPVDTSVPRQQHGYLSMQFTRSMSSLGDDYGFIFDTQAADIDMLDVVLQRRILVVLIPALEKSGDETANLGKIISSTLKGMMGQTLGSAIEGEVATVIENKVTTSATPFMAIFDEVGYYTAQGMAVMAAQARSLGFSLIFSAQDLPALEKRVKEEARSITANCNIKLFGKIEDPTQTKEFFEKTVGQALVTEVSGFARNGPGSMGGTNYMDSQNASVQVRGRVPYEWLKGFNEGRAVCSFGMILSEIQIYNSDVGHAKAMRVHRFIPVPPPSEDALQGLQMVNSILTRFRDPNWRPDQPPTTESPDIDALARGFSMGRKMDVPLVECGILSIAAVAEQHGTINPADAQAKEAVPETAKPAAAPAAAAPKPPAVTEAPAAARPVGGDAPAAQAEAPEQLPAPAPQQDGFSWESVIGLAPPPTAAPTEENQPVSWESALGLTPPPASPANEPPAADGPSTLSWGDIIGGGTTPDEDNQDKE